MNIFISFAGEQARDAESIYRKLLAAGYDVFFSSDDIRAAEGYDEVIRNAVEAADGLIFLASPDSLAKGRYTLTEIEMFAHKWPDPTGRVMTVMLGDVSYDDVPPYLGAVTSAITPKGNVASEVTAVVVQTWSRFGGSLQGRPTNVFGGILLIVLLGLGTWLVLGGRDSPPWPLTSKPDPVSMAWMTPDRIRTGDWGAVYHGLSDGLRVQALAEVAFHALVDADTASGRARVRGFEDDGSLEARRRSVSEGSETRESVLAWLRDKGVEKLVMNERRFFQTGMETLEQAGAFAGEKEHETGLIGFLAGIKASPPDPEVEAGGALMVNLDGTQYAVAAPCHDEACELLFEEANGRWVINAVRWPRGTH